MIPEATAIRALELLDSLYIKEVYGVDVTVTRTKKTAPAVQEPKRSR